MKICFDEWNVWDERKGNSKNGLEQWYDYTDMLGFVAWLHVLVRQSKDVAIACLAQSVNVVSTPGNVVSVGKRRRGGTYGQYSETQGQAFGRAFVDD